MASYSVAQAANKTLSTTVVDDITLTEPHGQVKVLNRAAATTIWVSAGLTPDDPAVAGDDSIPVTGGQSVAVAVGTAPGFVVKVVGSGDDYSVVGLPRTV